jgi:tripartite-type tricarboxylate transporter receptor subunit TctC
MILRFLTGFHKQSLGVAFSLLVITGLLLLPGIVKADFPEKPIKIVVYTGPGGLIDISARKFAGIAAKYVDVNFVVENKPGAGGIVALKKSSRHRLMATISMHVQNQILQNLYRLVVKIIWMH